MENTTDAASPIDSPVGRMARKLAGKLQSAGYNCGYEDAHPSNATSRQASADAKCREVLAALYMEIDRLQAGHDRYELARRMNPQQWRDAWILNIRTGKTFDEIVDDMRPFLRPNAI